MAAHDENNKNNPLEKPSDNLDLDQLQDEFDSLISDSEQSKTEDIQAAEQNLL